MTFTLEATYEAGTLKLEEALPFKEQEKVRVTIQSVTSLADQTAGLLRWSGDVDDLRCVAEDEEFGFLASQMERKI